MITPVEYLETRYPHPRAQHGVFFKRDDLFVVAGACGGKARACQVLAQGAQGLTTAGSRRSAQAQIVARVAHSMGLSCRVHMPRGATTPEMEDVLAHGAEIVPSRAGYNNVIASNARKDAEERGWVCVPFGMECDTSITTNSEQAAALGTYEHLSYVERIIVPVGKGMSVCGILVGLLRGRVIPDKKVIGVCVGGDPRPTLDKWGPWYWDKYITLVDSGSDYETPATAEGCPIDLDPYYEAKAWPFVEPNDLLWVVGRRCV